MTDKAEQCIVKTDGRYPDSLRRIACAPGRLYVRGALPAEDIPSVAVIGARRCSSYGREMARWFAGELAGAGVQIISGMALGIDGIAQRAALSAGGRSFGVLGSGTDICYPEENRDLYESLAERGGIMSEHPAGTPPLAKHFPSRNRMISALSDIVLVIEAKERSGTLITVDFALEQGKDVYVLPGRITDGLSCGCNSLLRQGAGIALAPSDILEALQRRGRPAARRERAGDAPGPAPDAADDCGKDTGKTAFRIAGERERIVWEHMGERPITPQELYEKIRASGEGRDMKLREVTDILVDFVMREIISQEYGNQYEKKKGIHSFPV